MNNLENKDYQAKAQLAHHFNCDYNKRRNTHPAQSVGRSHFNFPLLIHLILTGEEEEVKLERGLRNL